MIPILFFTGRWLVLTLVPSQLTLATPTASVRPPIVAGLALDGKGWLVVQLFYYVLLADFSCCHLGAVSAKLATLL
jgi:hypothetical protein